MGDTFNINGRLITSEDYVEELEAEIVNLKANIREIVLNPKYGVDEFERNKHGVWHSVQDGKLSLIKELTSDYKHSDKNTEAYCENLQRENKFLRDQLDFKESK